MRVVVKGVELLISEFESEGPADGFMSVTIALMFFFTVYVLEMVGRGVWFRPGVRGFLGDYAYPVSLLPTYLILSHTQKHHPASLPNPHQIATLFWTGFAHFPGQLRATNISKLPHTRAFHPTVDRDWLIDFWTLDLKWIFVALPIGFLLMLLFYYDHVRTLHHQSQNFLSQPCVHLRRNVCPAR